MAVKMDLETRVRVFEKEILTNTRLPLWVKFNCLNYLFQRALVLGEIEIAMAIDKVWSEYINNTMEVIEDEA